MGEVAELSLFPLMDALTESQTLDLSLTAPVHDQTLDLTPFDDFPPGFESYDAFHSGSDWFSDELPLARHSSGSVDPDGGTIEGFDSDHESYEEPVVSLSFGHDHSVELEWEQIDARPVGVDDAEVVTRNIDWEVLLAVNDAASSVDEHEDFVYTSEYEVLFGQFEEHAFSLKGPPAAKSVVESLPSVKLSKDDVEKANTTCAVCKDDISREEPAAQLPCLHHYHGECILTWLGIRNTCPVCRYELPTDDAEYEKLKGRRAGGGGNGAPEEESQASVSWDLRRQAASYLSGF
ncbi:putative transcription factor C2H2 family [Dioscorea sansibarensis]